MRPLLHICQERGKNRLVRRGYRDTIGKSTYRDVSFILCNASRAAEGETKTGSSGSIMRTDTSRSLSLSLSLCLSLSRSRSFSRSRGSLSLIPDSLSCCRSLCSFSVLLSRTLSRSRSRFLSHAVSPRGGKGGDTVRKKERWNIN